MATRKRTCFLLLLKNIYLIFGRMWLKFYLKKNKNNFRNWYDWVCILLLITCIATHVADIVNHTTHLAQVHIRIMSITVVVVCFRLLKTSQILIPHFGTIVQMFIFSLPDIVNWFCLFCCIWLPFSVTFWVLYGGKQFAESSLGNTLCIDVENANNTKNNCTTIEIETFKTFPTMAYWLYRLTLAIPLEDVTVYIII